MFTRDVAYMPTLDSVPGRPGWMQPVASQSLLQEAPPHRDINQMDELFSCAFSPSLMGRPLRSSELRGAFISDPQCLSTSDRSGPHAHIRRGPQPATSPLSQLSLDFSKQRPLLSENLKRGSDKAEELPETDPCVYLAAAWQSPIPTVEAVRASHTDRPLPPPPPTPT
ncbi:zinc finger E-box-binding homeobox 2 [Lates japonicus]|uniref:Zinc finger E-box-binding homeobox 2 n=1 Tax=Lates japonicus TaxID=270547 RepID=A0AAD3MY30_LATJO|nr:zinc finger E-box-binding homeobox 2 [Lates japonicus]